jgi:hypothetical protein
MSQDTIFFIYNLTDESCADKNYVFFKNSDECINSFCRQNTGIFGIEAVGTHVEKSLL